MIELVLRTDAENEGILREMADDRPGIEVVGITLPDLYRRADVDTLVLGDHLACEYHMAQSPRTLGWVVVDSTSDIRRLVYAATITPANLPGAALRVAASWIVVIPLFAASNLAGEGEPAAVQMAERGRRASIPLEVVQYPLYLNAFEVMEQHNAAGKQPAIHRAAIMVDRVIIPSVLRAHDIYRERMSRGLYRLQ